MGKEHTLSQPSGRMPFKELRQIIRTGLVQGNLVLAFVGTWLAIVMTNHSFLSSIPQILLMLIGSMLVMGGACALNNYYDQDIDKAMSSKQSRPTVNNRISDKHLLMLGFGMMLVGEACLFLLNVLSGVLRLLGIVGYISYYSIWSKRHTIWNTVVGSFLDAVPPLIEWTAIDGQISLVAFALFLVVFCWQPIYFHALVIKRSDECSLADIPMLPSVKGFKRTRISMLIWLVLLLPLPFLLSSLDTTFVVLAILLNSRWIFIGSTTPKKNAGQTKRATKMSVYSLNYLVVFFALVVVISLMKVV